MRTAQDFILEIPVLKPGDLITRARQILRDDRFREIYVADVKKNLLGYIDITDGLRVTATKSNITIEGFVKEAPMVHPADSIEVAARAMRSYRTDSAAVVDPEPRSAGGVLLSDLFPVIISRHELHGTVESRMSPAVVTLAQDDEIPKAYARIMESGFTAFPVLKKKRLVGIVSRRDLIGSRRVRGVIAEHGSTPVESIMTTDVVTIAPGEPVSAAAELLVKHDVSRLPVLDGNLLVGIIDRHDVRASMA